MTTTDPRKALKPFFTYFGGKYRAAKHYPVPEHRTIIEPFAGAAGYSMRYPHHDVVLVELNEKVVGTWDYLINADEDEIRALPVYDGTWETVDDLSLPQEAKWLIGWWLNKGTTSPGKRPSAWMRGGETGENYWGPGARERIASQMPSIRHWTIVHGSYDDYPHNDQATWFIDPPYQVAGKPYPHAQIDYPALAEWSASRQGQVMVCENAGADWLPFVPFRDIKGTAGGKRIGVSKEVIWTNSTGQIEGNAK